MPIGHRCGRVALLLAPLVLSLSAAAANAPYPPSSVITSATWDLSMVSSLRQASGSDLWPVTWGADGNVYGAWGDGGGFAGTDSVGRVSLGFARIGGTPTAGNPTSYTGINIWGAAPAYAQNPATFGGKIDELISIGGVLYAEGGLWTAANCGCADPTQKPDNGPLRTFAWSADFGATWQIAPWSTSSPQGNFLQFGEDYQGAWDPAHVYVYYQYDVTVDPVDIYLRRTLATSLTEDPGTAGHYEYFAGTDSTGAALWTTVEVNALPVFQDTNVPVGTYSEGAVIYDAPIGRYLLLAFHGDNAGQIGLFEGPTPWGPWATVDYEDDWGGFNETAGVGNGLQFPTKWISSDGVTLWAVFSGRGVFDSFNVAALTLTVSSSAPQIQAPAVGSVLVPGATVTVTGTGDALSWSVAYVGGAGIATGSGGSGTFVVPADAQTNQLIRLTLSNSLGQVYRDFAVSSGTMSVADTPILAPPSGSYSSVQSVTISDTTPGAVIYYTTDGSAPTTFSAVYSAPITVSSTETVNAIAAALGYNTSAMASATYTIAIPTAATPTFSPAAGTFSSAQSVTIGDTTPGATVHYTTDGSTPTTASAVYSAPINVSVTETLKALAVASGYNNSAVSSGSYTISAQGTTPISVNLTAVDSVTGIVADGTPVPHGGLDGDSTAYSATLLGSSLSWNGSVFSFGSAGSLDAVTSTTIALPAGNDTTVNLLATAVNGNQARQTFIVTYTDGSTSSFTQSLSDWFTPQNYAGESKVSIMPYRLSASGAADKRTFYLYGYSFAINGTKTVQSITLPKNRNVVVLAIDVSPAVAGPPPAATPTMSPPPGTYPSAQSVTLSDSTPGAVIYYSTNGTTPTLSSAQYSPGTPVPISATTTLQAIAVASGYSNSAVTSGTYTIAIPTAATPTFSPAAGTFSSAQSVTIGDTTPGAIVHYTTDGSTPTTASAVYSAPINVSVTETLKALAVASGYNNSAVSSGSYTISAQGTTPISVNLTAVDSVTGIVADGTPVPHGGLDGDSTAYSATLLGSSLSWSGSVFSFGSAGSLDAVTSTTIALPAGNDTTVNLLATAVNGNQVRQTFIVTYTDGSTSSFTQSLSDWFTPQNYAGESKVLIMPYRLSASGAADKRTFYLYGYSFAINGTKTVQSITLPKNRNVVVLAIDVSPAVAGPPPAAAPTMSPPPGTYPSAQSVTLSDSTPGAVIYYTTNGTTPTLSSAQYSPGTPVPISATTTLQAIAVASGYSNSAVTSGTYTIISQGAGPTVVDLSSVSNVVGIANTGSPVPSGGLDSEGYAYASALLGTSPTWNGWTFTLGAAEIFDAVSGKTIALPAGNDSVLALLATAVNGNQPRQTFIVTYTDGTTSSFTQSISDWFTPQNYAGESQALKMASRVAPSGAVSNGPVYVYGYSFAINNSKTLKSITLPNNRNLVVLSIDLLP